jgi:hypothetical protein
MRTRVTRLLNGNFREEDLTRLFLYLRDRADGRETLRDIGDFVAHQNERDKGCITRAVQDWYKIATFHAPNMFSGARADINCLPSDFHQLLMATFRRINPADLYDNIGFGRATAAKLLGSIRSKFIKNKDGTLQLPSSLAADDVALITYLGSRFILKPAFVGERLFSDFIAGLQSMAFSAKPKPQCLKLGRLPLFSSR